MWKVYKDFNNSFTIGEDELEKAIYCFITGKPVIFKSGASMRHIDSIMPDYNSAMGWNEGYKLGSDDWAEINKKGISEKLRDTYSKKADKVQYLIETKQENLIGSPQTLMEIYEGRKLLN